MVVSQCNVLAYCNTVSHNHTVKLSHCPWSEANKAHKHWTLSLFLEVEDDNLFSGIIFELAGWRNDGHNVGAFLSWTGGKINLSKNWPGQQGQRQGHVQDVVLLPHQAPGHLALRALQAHAGQGERQASNYTQGVWPGQVSSEASFLCVFFCSRHPQKFPETKLDWIKNQFLCLPGFSILYV